MATPPESWTKGLGVEADFWGQVLSGHDDRWKEGILKRFERRELHPNHRDMAERSAQGAPGIAILDVGAGPCTVLGCLWPGRNLTVTAVDPLADEYTQQLRDSGLTPPVPTIKGTAENLVEQFGIARFDFVFSHNAMDHCYNPILGLRQMISVAKPRACVQLEHRMNEGEFEKYHGLHQWNFCEEEGAFVIWNQHTRHNVSALFRDTHTVQCYVNNDWLSVMIRRN